MGSFFLPNWSPPDDPARPLPAEGRPWPSDDDDDDDGAPPWQPHMPGYLPGEEDRQGLNVAKNEIDDLKCNFKSKGVKTRSNLS